MRRSRGGRAPAPARAERRRAAAARLAAAALAGLAVADERDVRQRPQAAQAHRARDGRPAPARGGGPRPAQRRSRSRCATRPARCGWPSRSATPCRRASRYAPKGRWPSHEPAGANVNALNPGQQDRHRRELGRARRARRAHARVASADARLPRTSSQSLDLPPRRPARAAGLAQALRRRRALSRRDPELRGAALPRGAARDGGAPRRARAPRLAGLGRLHADRRRARRDGCDGTRGERRGQPLRAPERRLGHLRHGAQPRPAARSPRPRAGRSRSSRGSPMRAARPQPGCAAC